MSGAAPSAAAGALPTAIPLRPGDIFFGKPPSTPLSNSSTNDKPPVQHMSMLNGVLVAQPTSVVLEGEAAREYRNRVNMGGGVGGGQEGQARESAAHAKRASAEVCTVGVAQSIAGISKIRPTAAADSTGAAPTSASSRPKRMIRVPQRVIQGGLETKFDPDPYGIALHGLLIPQQYTAAISALNHALHPARSNNLDAALLATGPLIFPLAVWGVRHRGQVKKRKRLLLRGIDDFNRSHPDLLMRWHRRPASCLTIERRVVEVHGPSPVRAEWAEGSGVGSQPPMMVGEYVEAGEEDAIV